MGGWGGVFDAPVRRDSPDRGVEDSAPATRSTFPEIFVSEGRNMKPSDRKVPHQPVESPRRRGLRVWKLMVGVAVVGVLCSLVAAVNTAREAAREAQCRNNLKQIGLALANYQSSNLCLPPAITTDAQGRPMHSWRVLMRPYYDATAFYNAYNMCFPWNAPSHTTLVNMGFRYGLCPSDTRPTPPHRTDYMAVTGPGTAFPGPNRVADLNTMIREAHRQGRSQLPILLIEVVRDSGHWMQPGDIDINTLSATPSRPGRAVPGSGHGSHGTHAVLLDGSVITLPRNLTPAQLRAMCTLSPEDPSPH
jgi:hypothetical protein